MGKEGCAILLVALVGFGTFIYGAFVNFAWYYALAASLAVGYGIYRLLNWMLKNMVR